MSLSHRLNAIIPTWPFKIREIVAVQSFTLLFGGVKISNELQGVGDLGGPVFRDVFVAVDFIIGEFEGSETELDVTFGIVTFETGLKKKITILDDCSQ
jgi:hypothetical protein